jgi:hypothetical protein
MKVSCYAILLVCSICFGYIHALVEVLKHIKNSYESVMLRHSIVSSICFNYIHALVEVLKHIKNSYESDMLRHSIG